MFKNHVEISPYYKMDKYRLLQILQNEYRIILYNYVIYNPCKYKYAM